MCLCSIGQPHRRIRKWSLTPRSGSLPRTLMRQLKLLFETGEMESGRGRCSRQEAWRWPAARRALWSLAVAEIACSEVGVGVLLELGAELGGTTCVPVATSPDSEDVRWMGWSLDDSAEVVRVVGCTGGAAGSQLSRSMAASRAF